MNDQDLTARAQRELARARGDRGRGMIATLTRHERWTTAEIEHNAAAVVASFLAIVGTPRVELRRSRAIPPRLSARIVVGSTRACLLDLSPAMLAPLLASTGRVLHPRSGSIGRALRSRGLLSASCIATDLAIAVRAMLRAAIAAEMLTTIEGGTGDGQ